MAGERGTVRSLARHALDKTGLQGPGHPVAASAWLDLARALHCSQPDVSVLLKALNLKDEPQLAMVVRKGRTREVVNYHARAVDRLLKVLASPPKDLPRNALQALERIRRKRATFSGQ